MLRLIIISVYLVEFLDLYIFVYLYIYFFPFPQHFPWKKKKLGLPSRVDLIFGINKHLKGAGVIEVMLT